MATIRDLRAALGVHFNGVDTVMRHMRDAGLLPLGKPGRDGSGSAPIMPRDAAMVLLGLASLAWTDAVDSPEDAKFLAAFRLRGRGEVTALDILAGDIVATARGVANHTPAAWRIGEVSIVREGEGGDRLRFWVADRRAVARPDGRPRPEDLLVNRQTRLAAGVIVAVAALFRPVDAAELMAGAVTGGMMVRA